MADEEETRTAREQPVQSRQLWEEVADRLRAAILRGDLPPGSKLVETELADRYGTSRGPVREAIRELAREGLVAELPRRGTVVSTLTERDLAEVYAVREALDVTVCRAAIAHASDDEIDSLTVDLDAMESAWRSEAGYLEGAEHDLAFHRHLVALAGNTRISAIEEQMLTQTMLLLRTAAESNPTLRTAIEPSVHRDIHEALLARDDGRAQEAVEAHYRTATERLFEAPAGGRDGHSTAPRSR